ncbi:MAG: DNA polymerase ligase N-terminal domain-containing protein [Nocardioidaceae bacterium]
MSTSRPIARRFVVQLHRARSRHFDLRFEIDGALASWAVPRGPTLDPAVRRSATHVDDHPLEYLDFEGVIPSGYGAGDVIVWDIGTWEPHGTDDPAAAVAAGELHAEVTGRKLHGRMVLVRRGADRSGRDQWLLVHKRDDHAVEAWRPEDHPKSVITGRTSDEVRADPERLWRSDLPAAQALISLRAPLQSGPSADELTALEELGTSGIWEVYGRKLRLTNLDKVIFPAWGTESAVTKREIIAYAARIAPVVLPYLAGRALNMHRYPNGADNKGLRTKQLPAHAPKWIPRWDNPEAKDQSTTYLVVGEAAALVWAANLGAVEWHPWTSTTAYPHRPSYALIDIDPGSSTSWDDVLVLARLHRTALEHLGVCARPKVSGRGGIQMWVPITGATSFTQTRAWVERLSRSVGEVVPELLRELRERGGGARLDYTQNAINKTLVAPYSPRAHEGAPVSVPLEWADLDDPLLRPDTFTIRTVFDRIADRGDPFRRLLTVEQTLPSLG